MKKLLLIPMMVLAFVGTAWAQPQTMLEITGYLYEQDGFPPSVYGELLSGVGFVETVSSELDWNPALDQLTWVVSGLTSTGQSSLGSYILVNYQGGRLDIVADRFSSSGHTQPLYGTEPPNTTAPGLFLDGVIYLTGEFTSFQLLYNPTTGSGHFEGHLIFTGGSELSHDVVDPEGYTVAGAIGPGGAFMPAGYDLEAIGQISFDPTIPTVQRSWGGVKNLYR
jgi:hypothetical protein